MKNPYKTLPVMLGTSFIVMYSIMFFNVAQLDHIYLSLTRLYMTLLMVAPMAIIMVVLNWKNYKHKAANVWIIIGATVVFSGAFFLLRTQQPIGDVQYMKAMIPHHSSAILTSEQANIQDPEVRVLADQIIEAQKQEIDLMKSYIERLEK